MHATDHHALPSPTRAGSMSATTSDSATNVPSINDTGIFDTRHGWLTES